MSQSNIELDAPIQTSGHMVLNWSAKDIEQRIGLRGGRFTRANTFFTLILGVLGAMSFYSICFYLLVPKGMAPAFTEKFTARGYIPYLIVFFFSWGIATLFVKWRKLLFQEKALQLNVVPDQPDFLLNPTTAREALNRMEQQVDLAHHFVLLNRIEVALSNLQNIGQISEVSSILNAQSRIDEQQIGSSYNLLRGFIWAIPVLGFIGTVIGLGVAIGGFGETINATKDVEEIKSSLSGVTGGLATAFDTTLVGLLATIVLHFLTNFLKFRELLFLDQCNDYCQIRVLSKLRLS